MSEQKCPYCGIEHFQELLLLYRSPRWEDDATGENLSLLDLLDCGIEDGMAVISDLAEYLSVHFSDNWRSGAEEKK